MIEPIPDMPPIVSIVAPHVSIVSSTGYSACIRSAVPGRAPRPYFVQRLVAVTLGHLRGCRRRIQLRPGSPAAISIRPGPAAIDLVVLERVVDLVAEVHHPLFGQPALLVHSDDEQHRRPRQVETEPGVVLGQGANVNHPAVGPRH